MTATPKITYRQYGGKASIAKWIVSHFPEHRVYMEPCCASAAVLLAKPRSFVEIINDLDDRIMGMWRAIKSQPEQLAALLWATPYTAANWRSLPPPGRHRGGRAADGPGRAVLLRQRQLLNLVARTSAPPRTSRRPRSGPTGSCGCCRPPIESAMSNSCTKMDSPPSSGVYKTGPDTLIYVDPPYVGHEKEYRYRIDYPAMVELLKAASARVVVSESPAADSFFSDWNRIERDTPRRGACERRGKCSNKIEVLFTNF